MLSTTDQIIAAALALPDEDRLHVVDRLLETFDQANNRIDALQLAEAERRLRDYRAGNIAAIPADEVFDSLTGPKA